MPRNSSGTYTLAEPAFVPSTPISSTAMNSDFDDVADALTDSLSRTGDGGMQAALPLSGAGFFYQGDSNTGVKRTAADTQVIFCGGTDVVEVTAAGANVTGTLDADVVTQAGAAIIPAGVVWPYGGAAAPTGFLLCDGTSYLRTDYPALFTAIGVVFGAADGAHFNVPDVRGRVPAGPDGGTGRLSGYALATVGGVQSNTILQANLPAATLATTIHDSGHVHNMPLPEQGQTIGSPVPTQLFAGQNTTTATTLNVNSASATTGITADTALGGSGTALGNVQPTIGLTYIIKT